MERVKGRRVRFRRYTREEQRDAPEAAQTEHYIIEADSRDYVGYLTLRRAPGAGAAPGELAATVLVQDKGLWTSDIGDDILRALEKYAFQQLGCEAVSLKISEEDPEVMRKLSDSGFFKKQGAGRETVVQKDRPAKK
ncbi:MAG: hypothetical protein L0216_06925 [Planctomycetales bacterium]|nr:hypothetical protein [Planctomycetales bacterium]